MSTSAHPVRAESPHDPRSEPQTSAGSLLAATKRILEMIAVGATLTDILTSLCDAIDAQNPDIISTILLMDPDGRRLWPAAGPRVPGGWARAITPLTIGPDIGSCGTAAFLKERVIIADISSDPRWGGAPPGQSRDVAIAHGLRAACYGPGSGTSAPGSCLISMR